MAKTLKTEKSKQGNGVDPEKWESAPAEAVGQVSNASIVSMTGGDAGTFEGIVDYILMGEERDAPSEGEIVAAEESGLLQRDFPSEVETEGTVEGYQGPTRIAPTKTSEPTYDGGSEALELDGVGGGDMGLEGLESGEVGNYSHTGQKTTISSGSGDVPTGITGGLEGGKVAPHKPDDLKVFKAIGGPDPSQLSAKNASILSSFQGLADGLAGDVEGTLGSALGSYDGAHKQNQSALDGAFGANLSMIQGAFGDARSRVDAASMSAKDKVEGVSSKALADIQTQSTATLTRGMSSIDSAAKLIIAQASSTKDAALGEVDKAKANAVSISEKWAKEARKKGDSMAEAYRNRGNGGTEGKRDEARAQVAEGYGKGYEEDIPSVGKDAAETLESEKDGIRTAINELIRQTLQEDLPALRRNLKETVSETAKEARAGVAEARDDANESIDEQHTKAGEELASAETAALSDLAQVHGSADGELASAHEAGQSSLEAMTAGLKGHIVEKAVQFRSMIAKNDSIPLEKLQKEVATLSAELKKQAAQAQSGIEQSATELAEMESELTTDAVEQMNLIGSTASQGAADMAGSVEESLGSLATDFETGIDGMMGDFTKSLDRLETSVQENVTSVLEAVLGGLGQTLTGVREGLQEFESGFDTDLGKAITETMVSDIQAKAEEEAAKIKEPSFWQKVASVVKILVVIIVVVAITVLTAGIGTAFLGAGLGMTMLAGALVGAVSAALTQIVFEIATKGIDPRKWDWGKIGVEALVGGIVGGLTAGLGHGLKTLGQWGNRVRTGTATVRSPAMARFATAATYIGTEARELRLAGRVLNSVGGSVLSQAGSWAKSGKRPTLLDVAGNIALASVANEFGHQITQEFHGAKPEEFRDGFTAFMAWVGEEAATGKKSDEILENLKVPIGDLGQIELTTDYTQNWSPTW